jgi:hypothetical protein
MYTLHFLNRRLYNPEIAKGDFSDIKGDLPVASNSYLSAFRDADLKVGI